MKYTFAALAFASAAFGASSPLIPSNLSAGCTAFLEKFNSDSTLQGCIKPIVDATAGFSPISENSASASDVESTLTKLCAGGGIGCDAATLGQQVASFGQACKADLNNAEVRALYDVLYVTAPLRDAVCMRDSASQKFCVNTIAASSKSKRAAVTNNFAKVVTPNVATYQQTNLPFLFLTPETGNSTLCTSCTSGILVGYLKFETKYTYEGGISKSMLSGQQKLMDAVAAKCPKGINDPINAVKNAEVASNGAFKRAGVPAFVTLVAGALAVAFAA